jgi:hypothetical protein
MITFFCLVYRLQQEAPNPKPVSCKLHVTNCPSYYGQEFHGVISHIDASAILEEDGAYLVRQSEGSNGFYTLTLRYEVIFRKVILELNAECTILLEQLSISL